VTWEVQGRRLGRREVQGRRVGKWWERCRVGGLVGGRVQGRRLGRCRVGQLGGVGCRVAHLGRCGHREPVRRPLAPLCVAAGPRAHF
jgi:hypothetical protein